MSSDKERNSPPAVEPKDSSPCYQ